MHTDVINDALGNVPDDTSDNESDDDMADNPPQQQTSKRTCPRHVDLDTSSSAPAKRCRHHVDSE